MLVAIEAPPPAKGELASSWPKRKHNTVHGTGMWEVTYTVIVNEAQPLLSLLNFVLVLYLSGYNITTKLVFSKLPCVVCRVS